MEMYGVSLSFARTREKAHGGALRRSLPARLDSTRLPTLHLAIAIAYCLSLLLSRFYGVLYSVHAVIHWKEKKEMQWSAYSAFLYFFLATMMRR